MNKYLKYFAYSAAAVVLMPMAACSDDDEVDPYDINYIYLYQPDETFAAVEYKANGNFLGDFEDPLELVPVRLTKPAPTDISVHIDIDETLVSEYNEANGTDYTYLSGAAIVNPNMTIAQGKYITDDKIKISFADRSGFMNNAENLILPVVIKQATKGVTISESSRIFLTFNSTYRANKVSVDAPFLSIDTSETGWESAYSTYTIEKFATAEWAADAAITLSLQIDNTLIASYNSANGTDCKPLNASLSSSQLSIAAGKMTADLKLSLGDYTGVADGDEYLVPIKVSSFSGVGAELENDVVYFQIGNKPPVYNVGSSESAVGLGTALTPGSWTMTSSMVGYSYTDEETTNCTFLATSPGYGYYGFDEGAALTVDFGSVISIEGFRYTFYAWYYSVKSFAAVETSKDGATWSSWDLDGTFPSYSTTLACKFAKTTKCRYLRVTMGAPSYSSYYGSYATGFYAY
jgi:hypothetical protein